MYSHFGWARTPNNAVLFIYSFSFVFPFFQKIRGIELDLVPQLEYSLHCCCDSVLHSCQNRPRHPALGPPQSGMQNSIFVFPVLLLLLILLLFIPFLIALLILIFICSHPAFFFFSLPPLLCSFSQSMESGTACALQQTCNSPSCGQGWEGPLPLLLH